MTIEKLVKEIKAACGNERIFARVWNEENATVIHGEIEWGDWKHEHMRFKLLVREIAENNGYDVLSNFQNVTDDDGSDCYSAVHTFVLSAARDNLEENFFLL